MAEYLLEFYVPRQDEQGASDGAESARVAAGKLRRRGSTIRFRWSIFLPAEETCFVLFEADSPLAVRHAAVLAELPPDRINAIARRRGSNWPVRIWTVTVEVAGRVLAARSHRRVR